MAVTDSELSALVAGGLSEESAIHFAEAYASEETRQDLVRLQQLVPGVLEGYLRLRRAALGDQGGGLTPAVCELVILAIECTAAKTNPPPLMHARKAIEAGATPAEVAQVLSLCIQLAGMMTFMESGRFVLRAAEEAYEQTQGEQAQGEQAVPGPAEMTSDESKEVL